MKKRNDAVTLGHIEHSIKSSIAQILQHSKNLSTTTHVINTSHMQRLNSD